MFMDKKKKENKTKKKIREVRQARNDNKKLLLLYFKCVYRYVI